MCNIPMFFSFNDWIIMLILVRIINVLNSYIPKFGMGKTLMKSLPFNVSKRLLSKDFNFLKLITNIYCKIKELPWFDSTIRFLYIVIEVRYVEICHKHELTSSWTCENKTVLDLLQLSYFLSETTISI